MTHCISVRRPAQAVTSSLQQKLSGFGFQEMRYAEMGPAASFSLASQEIRMDQRCGIFPEAMASTPFDVRMDHAQRSKYCLALKCLRFWSMKLLGYPLVTVRGW